jgi:hypothetical protein
MVRVAKEHIESSLAEITRREVDMYSGPSHQADLYSVLDDENQRYAVVVVAQLDGKRTVWVMMMAHVADDYIVIDEDTTLEKHLVDALMVNGDVPRDKIILAYKGETLPTQTTD